jgi:hypothetical protein
VRSREDPCRDRRGGSHRNAADHDPPGGAAPFRPAAFGRRRAKCVSALRNPSQNPFARRGEFGDR